MIVVASVSASAAATAFVPAARIGFSNTPIGPFQTTVLAVFTASAYNSIVLGPISQASLSAAIASASYTYVGISASIGLGKASTITESTGRSNFLPRLSAFSIISLQ